MPINLPLNKICIRCKKPFVTTLAFQEICGGCPSLPPTLPMPPLSEPSKLLKKEKTMSASTCAEKICVDCKEPFKPSCNNQKRCPKCMEKKTHKKKTAGPSVEISKKPALFNSEILEALTALKSAGFIIIARKGPTEIIIG